MALEEGRFLVTVIVHQVVDGRTKSARVDLEAASAAAGLDEARERVLVQLRPVPDVSELPAGQLDDSRR